MAEYLLDKEEVVGSNPTGTTKTVDNFQKVVILRE